ncbi:class I SAM-dependent DNA methyltransferase [Candidatus Leptofilum sp.]|uniref:class I SAM-dependent DNA methyltransferase n=1 Tax=Candidatus Leptofilum sp. TaxID=3241576 RepID=UPI003B5B2208
MSNKDEMVRALYDGVAETYLDSVERTNYIGPQWLLENLQADFQTSGLRILDLGCANGINIANLNKINPSIVATGVDISEKMIAEAQKANLYEYLHHQSLDAALTFSEPNSYGMAIALGCLEFVNDVDFCLREAARVCTENSHLYASFQRFELDNPAAPRRMKSGAVTHFAYSTSEILAKLGQAGFQIVSTEELIGYTGGVPCPYTFVVAQKKSVTDGIAA